MAGNLLPPDPSETSSASAGLPQVYAEAGAPSVAPPPFEAPSEGMPWDRYLAALRRYKWMILAVILVGTGLGIVATRFLNPEYEVKATIFIRPQSSPNGPIQPDAVLEANSWAELLTTYEILDEVVRRERLYLRPAEAADSLVFRNFQLGDAFQPGAYTLTVDETGRHYTLKQGDDRIVEQGSVGGPIGRRVGFRWSPAAPALGRDRDIEFTVVTPRQASSALQKQLNPLLADKGSFMTLVLTGTNPVRIAGTMNTLLDVFSERAAELQKSNLVAMVKQLREQLDTINAQLRTSEDALERYRVATITKPSEQTPVAPPSGLAMTGPTAEGAYFQNQAQLDELEQQRSAINAALARNRDGQLVVDQLMLIPSVQTSLDMKTALDELAKTQNDLRIALDRYTPAAPQVQALQQKVNRLRTQTIPAQAQAIASALGHQADVLRGRIGRQKRDLQQMPERSTEENRLNRNVETLADLQREVASRYQQAKMAEASAQPDVQVVDRAVVPEDPTSNSAPRIILLAFFASVGLAVGLAILLDQLDKRFRYPDQVTRELGLSILGAIPQIRKVRPGERDAEEAAQVVEAFRTVRMNLAHSYGAAGPVQVTISSPGAGDGKSLVSSNLALSFAEAGYRTILIDGDIRRGELHRMFNADRRPGLLDYLSGQVDMAAILRPTTHKNLTMVPCGTRHQHGPELLGSAGMRELMAELKQRYNVIIVDSPPLGAGIDPFVLSTATGNLMLVLRSGASDRQMAEAKLRLMDRLPVRILGAVLNDVSTSGVYKYYSYIYGYTADEDATPQLAAPGGKSR